MHLKVAIAFLILNHHHYGVLGDGTCPEIPLDICPYGMSEYTGESVKLVPKYLTRDHPEYDVRTPEEARDKMNLYCAHPACYSHPCLNGATCFEELDGYSCSCLGEYIGIHCEQHVSCPVGWVYGQTKCFLITNMRVDWTSARNYCNGLEAVTMGSGETVEPSLIFTENMEEYDLLKPHVGREWVWINCNFVETFICYTDRAGTTSDYRNWGNDQPQQRDGENCAMIIPGFRRMHDHFCTRSVATVCQINI